MNKEYKNETYRLTLRDYKNTESLSECSKEVDSTLANYKCQNEFDVMKIDNAGECGFVGGKYKKISDDEIRKIKGLPVARYDDETGRAYLEYPDGRREYLDD